MLSIYKSDSTYNLIKQGLNVATTRAEVISNNIANVNTKGYKRSYVNFEENLKKDTISKKVSNSKHIGNNEENIRIEVDNTTSMKSDGNNVDIDLEKVDQASNSLMYNALITSVNSKITTTSYIIQGGR